MIRPNTLLNVVEISAGEGLPVISLTEVGWIDTTMTTALIGQGFVVTNLGGGNYQIRNPDIRSLDVVNGAGATIGYLRVVRATHSAAVWDAVDEDLTKYKALYAKYIPNGTPPSAVGVDYWSWNGAPPAPYPTITTFFIRESALNSVLSPWTSGAVAPNNHAFPFTTFPHVTGYVTPGGGKSLWEIKKQVSGPTIVRIGALVLDPPGLGGTKQWWYGHPSACLDDLLVKGNDGFWQFTSKDPTTAFWDSSAWWAMSLNAFP